jgi:putative transcription factor
MQKQGAKKTDKKQADFDAAFEKLANKLPQEYKEQFKRNEPKGPSKETKIKEAMRTGGKVEIVAKSSGNKAHAQNLNIPKILEDEHPIEIKEVPKEIATQVAKARLDKKLSQDQLATKICEKAHVVKDLEAGHGLYDPKVVEKIEKALGVKFDRPWKK